MLKRSLFCHLFMKGDPIVHLCIQLIFLFILHRETVGRGVGAAPCVRPLARELLLIQFGNTASEGMVICC